MRVRSEVASWLSLSPPSRGAKRCGGAIFLNQPPKIIVQGLGWACLLGLFNLKGGLSYWVPASMNPLCYRVLSLCIFADANAKLGRH